MATKLTQAEADDLIRQFARDLITEELAELHDIMENGYKVTNLEDPTQPETRKPMSAGELRAARLEARQWQFELEAVAELSGQPLIEYIDINFDMSLAEIYEHALIA